jgi:ribosomal-protein-alanine N-acetyltransferase
VQDVPEIPALTDALTDGVVTLRESSERDIPEILIAYQDDPEMHLRLGDPAPPTGAQLGSAAESAEEDRREGKRLRLAILEPGGDRCRGRLTVHSINWEHRRAELAIWVAPQYRGRGYARSALLLSSAWLFEACGLERLALLTEPANQPMLRSAEAAGFVREGVMREYEREQGQRADIVLLSLLPADMSGNGGTS